MYMQDNIIHKKNTCSHVHNNSTKKARLSTAYPPLIHPMKTPLNRGVLSYTSDGKTGKLLTGTQANFRESIRQYWSDNGVVTGKTAER